MDSNSSLPCFRVYTDGGARGNPGPAGAGAVIVGEDGDVKGRISQFLGTATNNQAEYQALILALQWLREREIRCVDVFMDSELIVRQLQGKYKVKDKELARLFVRVWNMLPAFKKVSFHHIPREQNKEADALVNKAIDREAPNS